MYDDDNDLCDDMQCSVCAPRRAARADRAARDGGGTPPAPVADGVLSVPPVVEADTLLTAFAGDGTVTLTREDARRVVATLATRRAPDDASTIEGLRARLTEARAAHTRDIATIGDTLMREAEDRSWCGEYDRVVEELNAELSISLPLRARDVTLYLSDDDGRNYYYVTVSIAGEEDEGDAARQVLDALRGSVNDWGYA